MDQRRVRRTLLALAALAELAACGGGGDDVSGAGGISTGNPSWTAGVYAPSDTFATRCAIPRSGIDPESGRPYADSQGTVLHENHWLRSWTHELYLWYSEVPDLNPALYANSTDYFDLLITPAVTPSGNPKDQFHFTYPTSEWQQLAQSGVAIGYGAQWAVISATPPREVIVAYTEPGSPATNAGLARGAKVLAVDGIDIDTESAVGIDVLNAGLSPQAAGEAHTFTMLDFGAAASRTVTLQSTNVTSAPVQNVRALTTPSGVVGYMLFNDHIATAEAALINAFTVLRDAGIGDLVLDIRYNGGGYLDIASEVAYMIAGPQATTGRTFEAMQFNDKYPDINPVTGAALTPLPFHDTGRFPGAQGQPLPSLGLSRVFVLTSSNTCSASESIINSLRGIDIEVIQIGSTTCGKPYGFYPQDNCGTTYFSIQFRAVNAKGFGEYADGFSPANTTGMRGSIVPGCSVADDFSHPLGDEHESHFAAALAYREQSQCPIVATGLEEPATAKVAAARLARDGRVHKTPWLENRILRP